MLSLDSSYIIAIGVISVAIIVAYFMLKGLLKAAYNPKIKSPISEILFFSAHIIPTFIILGTAMTLGVLMR